MLRRLATLAVAAALQGSGLLFAQFPATTPLPQALLSHTAVISGSRIYVAGGVGDTGGIRGTGGFLNNVYYCASINADGSLGDWQVASPMPNLMGLGMHASAAYNGKIYVLGGNNMFGPRNTVYYASPAADGTLPAWVETTPMPQKLMAHAAAVSGGRIYVLGGIVRSAGSYARIYSNPIAADGALGAWREEISLPSRLFGHQVIVHGGKLLVIGGSSDPTLYDNENKPPSNISAKVYAAAINADGTLGAWEESAALPKPVIFHALALTDKAVYVSGGFDGGVTNAVYFAPLLTGGALGAWQPLQTLPANLLSLASVSNGDYLYTLGGGLSYVDQPQDAVYYLKIKQEPKAFVKLNPDTINRKSQGKWVTAIIGLPEADISKIVPSTVKISAINGQAITPIFVDPKWTTKFHTGDCAEFDGMAGVSYAMVKFDRQALSAILPEGDLDVKIEGNLSDGRKFDGESVNRAINSLKTTGNNLTMRGGERVSPSGVKVYIPADAFPGNPDLLLTVANEDEAATAKEEKERREQGKKNKNLASVSSAVEFGPPGMRFEKPVTIAIPYDAAAMPAGAKEDELIIAYWNAEAGDWEALASAVSKGEKLVRADVAHFSIYQVMTGASPLGGPPVPDESFRMGEVYVYPNPAKKGQKPVIHAQAPSGDAVNVKVYTVSGRLAQDVTRTEAPRVIDDGNGADNAYEVELNGDFSSGIYYYSVEVSKGAQKIRKSGKFAVVR